MENSKHNYIICIQQHYDGNLIDLDYYIKFIEENFKYIYIWHNSPLENVFLHLDLDMIQSQISTVIKNQQKQILQQAIIISQNKEIIEQNQLVLDNLATLQKDTSNMNAKLDSINANSAEAAEWARIAASHAEACAWLGVANYIKDM